MTPKVKPSDRLNAEIARLELQLSTEKLLLQAQLSNLSESVRPINLIKSTFQEFVSNEDPKSGFLNTGFGMATGFVAKNIFQLISNNPVKKGIGTVMMVGITNLIDKHPETWAAISGKIKNLFGRKKKPTTIVVDAEVVSD